MVQRSFSVVVVFIIISVFATCSFYIAQGVPKFMAQLLPPQSLDYRLRLHLAHGGRLKDNFNLRFHVSLLAFCLMAFRSVLCIAKCCRIIEMTQFVIFVTQAPVPSMYKQPGHISKLLETQYCRHRDKWIPRASRTASILESINPISQ